MNQILDKSGIMLDAILKSNDMYRLAFDVSKSALAVVGGDRKFMRANQEFCRLTGYGESELIGLSLDDLLDSATCAARFINTDYRRKNGESRRGRLSFHAAGEDGACSGWIIDLEDIPGTGQSRDAALRHEEFFNCMIESNADGILFLDASGRILHMNEAARKQMGSADFNAAIDMDYANFWKGPELSAALTAIEAAANGMTGQFQACTRSNPPRWWDVTITPIPVKDGGIHRLMVISRDITQKIRAEQMLEFAKKQLEKTIRECGKLSLRNERVAARLRKALADNDTLAASAREKETRAREIHHRAKNNLQIMASMVHLQTMRVADENAAGILENVRGRLAAMARVHDMFCRMEKSSRINLREYITALVSEISASLGKKELIRITADMEDLYLGINEAVPCGLLVNEIATNAVKHAFPGGQPGEITVRLKTNESGDRLLTIQDDGIGLAEKVDIDRPATLGMELIRELVLQLGGTVELGHSGGTSYTIQFPQSAGRTPR